MKRTYTLFILLLLNIILSASCNKVKDEDLQGEWIINKITYKGVEVKLKNTGFRITMLPLPYTNKSVLSFNLSNHSVQFPGINTNDIDCVWSLQNDTLNCSLDTIEFNNSLFSAIKDIKTQAMLKHDNTAEKLYQNKKDSILNAPTTQELKNATVVYLGDFSVQKTNKAILLTSKSTYIELINMEKALKSQIDNMFKGL